jgi:predicted metallo-beta-lactamase superfamily hydrolase
MQVQTNHRIKRKKQKHNNQTNKSKNASNLESRVMKIISHPIFDFHVPHSETFGRNNSVEQQQKVQTRKTLEKQKFRSIINNKQKKSERNVMSQF